MGIPLYSVSVGTLYLFRGRLRRMAVVGVLEKTLGHCMTLITKTHSQKLGKIKETLR